MKTAAGRAWFGWLHAQAQLGRQQGGQRWGPRPLDLDIIFYGGASVHEAGLEIPHPRWHERPFVQVAKPTVTSCHTLA